MNFIKKIWKIIIGTEICRRCSAELTHDNILAYEHHLCEACFSKESKDWDLYTRLMGLIQPLKPWPPAPVILHIKFPKDSKAGDVITDDDGNRWTCVGKPELPITIQPWNGGLPE